MLLLGAPFALVGYLVFNKRLHWNALQQWGVLNLLFILFIVLMTIVSWIICWIISASSMTPKPEEMLWIEYIFLGGFPFEILNHLMSFAFFVPLFCIPVFILSHLVKIFIESEIRIIISNRTKCLFLTGWLFCIPYLILITYIIDECGED